MQKLLFFISLFCGFLSAQTLQCRETCQYWDSFSNQCDYATRCEIGQNLGRYIYCDRYDNFARRCLSELTQVTPYHINPYAAMPSCTERCQYYDNFSGQCLYRTACAYSSYLLKYTECEKWDSFEQKCYYARDTFFWNVY